LCRAYNLGPQIEAVRRQLATLAGMGLLVSHADLLPRCRPAGPEQASACIAVLGVPTRGRTDSLRRCLLGFAENARRFGRMVEVVVADDSEPADCAANQELLREVASRNGVPVAYAGPAERRDFVERLARRAGLARQAVAFGLLNEEGCPLATGANRNALLLHAAGEAMLQVDDDVHCRLAPHPEVQAGLAFSSQYDPSEFWFLAEGAGVPGREDVDFVGLHESLLGRHPSDCGAAGEEIDLDQAGASFFRQLEGGGRVLVSAAGVVGDSGMSSPLHLLSLEGASRARLLRSEAEYRTAVREQRVLRAVPRTTICDGPYCMGLNLGLDNRRLLPPFMPVQRNQDGIFATLVRSCIPGGLFGFLPQALGHDCPRRGRTSADLRQWGRLRSGHVIQLLVSAAAPTAGKPAETLRAVGRTLADWGALERGAFEELVQMQLWGAMTRQAQRLEGQLRQYGGQPGFWAEDVRQVLAGLREDLPRPDSAVPTDLRSAFGEDGAREMLPRLVRRFGELLQVWPDMVEAARELRARGEGVARRLEAR
jgi:hypothetical protein